MSKLIAALAPFLLTAFIAADAAYANSDQESLLMERAELCGRAGRLEEANSFYTHVLAINSKNCQALDLRGDNRFALRQYQKSLDDTNRWIALCPGDEGYLRRAVLLIALGEPEAALADLDRCLNTREIPSSIEYLLLTRTIANLLSGHLRDAHADAYAHLNILPRSPLSFEVCSVSDALCGRTADAIANLAQFSYIRLHSGSNLYMPHYPLQNQYQKEGSFPQGALNIHQREQLIARLDKQHSGLSPVQDHFARAIIYFYQRDYDRSISEAARCKSDKMQFYPDLLTCYCQIIKREFPQALANLNHLTALFPDSPCVLDAVDLYHYQADKRQDSIAEIKAILAKNPKNEAALVELAKIHRDLSQLEEAIKYCNLALQLDPKSASLLLMKANILTSQKNYAQGLKAANAIIAVDHQNGAAYLARAAIYTQEGRWSGAIEDLTQAIRLKYALSKSLQARAACYGALKKFDLARQDRNLVNRVDAGAIQRLPTEYGLKRFCN